ncbi:MAG: type IV toxin-antitoxin system AbiEi family antitoxin domain-containing protein [Parachlamydia sp.]|nr:type IV toxin-antitoxin system AbiEi family antitoxin domain-containing protein [Parachlamydia sp.]
MKIPEINLFEIAESQQGYFTYQQAIAAGYSDKNHMYHIKTGDWVKVIRGIYRLAKYPVACTRASIDSPNLFRISSSLMRGDPKVSRI